MVLFLIGFNSDRLLAQPSLTCPDYSFCIGLDPLDCNKIKVSINGVQGLEISGLRFEIDVSGVIIDVQATEDEFSNTAIGQNFFSSSSLTVTQDLITINYAAFDPPPAYMVTEECLEVGTIVIHHIELDCISDAALASVQITPLLPGPLFIGPDISNSISCSQYTIDCPCSNDCSIDNWEFCFSQDGCGKVQVFLLKLQGVDNVSGIRFGFIFDPDLEIDKQKTKNAIENSQFLGGNNWEFDKLRFTQNTISFFYRNETGIGSNIGFNTNLELFFDIFFVPQPGKCYDFSSSGVGYVPQSGLFIGDDLSDPDLEFCDNFSTVCSGEVCSDGVLLSGNILRPTNAGSCNEAIDFGFPYGEVKVTGSYCNYDYEFVVLTDEEGYYELEVFPNNDYTVIPGYTEEHKHACGVNSIDLDIMQSVTVGSSLFPYPFSGIAGDVSLNGEVNAFDRALVWRYIMYDSIPPSGIWRFLPAAQYQIDFEIVPNPGPIVPHYDTLIVANVLNGNFSSANFRAIKMGDVDGSCQECLESGTIQSPAPSLLVSAQYDVEQQEIILSYSDYKIENVRVINLFVDGGEGIIMEEIGDQEVYSETYMEFRGTGSKGSGYGWISLEEKGSAFSTNQTLASFSVKEFETTYGLSITFGELVADGILYNLELDGDYVEILEKGDKPLTNHDQILVYPNPGKNAINISIPSEYQGPYEIVILDVLGRQHGIFQDENNEISILTSDLPVGSYILTVIGEDFSESIKWLKQ